MFVLLGSTKKEKHHVLKMAEKEGKRGRERERKREREKGTRKKYIRVGVGGWIGG